MVYWKIFIISFATSLVIECTTIHQKREISHNICDPNFNNTNKIQCFCVRDHRDDGDVRSADCSLTKNNTAMQDSSWNSFKSIKTVQKLILSNTRGVPLQYIPTDAIKHLPALLNINIKYGDIKEIKAYAFSNLSYVQEITLSDDQIEILQRHAFYNHSQLTTITLDKNRITEINRDVFVELPLLEKLFLTSNKITTIHDKAFIHLTKLKELELDRNSIFSLNSETFSGLKNLNRLELSGNSLEVIGDNTFLPLGNLQSLNLESNKIQMLDEKAFKGLSKLRLLSLARNKLSDLENVKVFEGLNSLISLSLKYNNIHHLKTEVMEPILHNFYENTSSFEFDENPFPCDCKLDWLLPLKNNTANTRIKLAIENLKCNPDTEIREKWKKVLEAEKSGGPTFDEDGAQNGEDYEYYDDSQLDGKLFYIDIRDLLNCSNDPSLIAIIQSPAIPLPKTTPKTQTRLPTEITSTTQKIPPTSKTTHHPSTTMKMKIKSGSDLLLNAEDESTTPSGRKKSEGNFPVSSEIVKNTDKKPSFTTSRLATVSPKPTENLIKNDYDKDMASDEAVPPNAHRQVQSHGENKVGSYQAGGSNINRIDIILSLLPILATCYRLLQYSSFK